MEASPPGQQGTFRTDIQGLRGIAVLLVIAFHVRLQPWSGGYVGVDVFFVLSGYLITGLLVREIDRTGTIAFAAFYARRARRLLPAAALVLAVTMLASLAVYSPLEQGGFLRVRLATALYASNVAFLRAATDYFAPDAAADPLLHTWSLSVEEQFYVVWPLLVWIAYRFPGRSRRRLAAVLAAVSVLSLVAGILVSQTRQSSTFFGVHYRAWQFGVGALAGLVPAARLRGRTIGIAGLAGLAAILVAGIGWSDRPFPNLPAALAVLGTTSVLLAGSTAPERGVARALSVRPLQLLGRLSYSWYLWHWPVIVLAAAVVPTLSLAGRMACAALALALAAITYRAVENPIRRHPRLMSRPYRTLALSAGVTAMSVALILAARQAGRRAASGPAQRAYAAAAADGSPIFGDCTTPFLESAPRECAFGPAGGRLVMLVGDSHAAHWFPAIERVARDSGWRVVTLVKSACPAADVSIFAPALGRAYPECDEWRRHALLRVAQAHPAVLLMSNLARYDVMDRGALRKVSPAEWSAGYRKTVAPLIAAGIPVVVMRDTPGFPFNVPVCLSRAARTPRFWKAPPTAAGCEQRREEALDTLTVQAARTALADLPGTSVLDLTDGFCDVGRCPTTHNGVVMYQDYNHMTASFARTLAARLAPALR